jgi:two-component system, OmpR family, sensor histidine kinase KdpD
MKRSLAGTLVALACMAVLTSAMLPVRQYLSPATTALVLVIPVIVGVVIGGFLAGVLSVTAGFLVYDFFFIKPYLTLWVGATQNWAALVVYVAVMLPVARVVAGLNAARAKERRLGGELTELFQLSGLLLEDKPLDELLAAIVTSVADVFAARQVALFLPAVDGQLQVASAAGEPLSDEQLRRVQPEPGGLARLGADPGVQGDLLVLALAASGRPVGLLALSADAAAGSDREPLKLFANQIALAVERAQLRDQVLQTRLTQEVSRLARTLVAAVSHDLRTPLATIKASSSTLTDDEMDLTDQSRHDLAKVIDTQADRLAELVQNLLDMSRIQAGVLQPRYCVISLPDLVTSVVNDLRSQLRGHVVQISFPPDPPLVDVDVMLISRVLTNLIENAIRHGPKGTPITIRAAEPQPGNAGTAETIEVSVLDCGRGIGPDRRDEIFGLLMRRPGDSGAGLGLSIAKTFVEAHGQRIWVEDGEPRGTRFCFTLPVAHSRAVEAQPEERRIAAGSHH